MDKKTVVALFFVGVIASILIIVFIEHSMNPSEKQPPQPQIESIKPSPLQVEQPGQESQAVQEERRAPAPMMQEFDSKTGDRKFLQ
jgi:hypothetical protein